MNQMTTDTRYRKINLQFLNNSGDDPFDIFYKTRSYGTIKYVRFATSKPEHHETKACCRPRNFRSSKIMRRWAEIFCMR